MCLISKDEKIVTLNPDGSKNMVGALLLSVLGTVAEFELKRIKERQAEGVAIAKAEGKYHLRKNRGEIPFEQLKLKPANKTFFKEIDGGETIARAAKLAGISRTYGYRLLERRKQQR